MPKKIENVKELLLGEAKNLLEKEGYTKLTMRSVAAACGLGLGTAYNYFSSKDELVASFVLEDWLRALGKMNECKLQGVDKLQFIYACLQEFLKNYEALFSDSNAKKSYVSSLVVWRKPLRDQLAQAILPVCNGGKDVFLSEFIAEALLRWSVEAQPFEMLAPILKKVIK